LFRLKLNQSINALVQLECNLKCKNGNVTEKKPKQDADDDYGDEQSNPK